MTKAHESGLRWKKDKSIVTYVLPNSEVQPEIVGEEADPPTFVSVHRVHEPFIRHILGDSEIVALRRVLTGNDIAKYESWKAPHLPPVDRHTKYVFKDSTRKRVSGPLFVCAPVQLTLEMKTDTSAKLGTAPFGSARGGIGRARTFNMQVSAATDPLVRLEITTPHQADGKQDLVNLLRNYAYELADDLKLDGYEIYNQLIERYSEFIFGEGLIMVEAEEYLMEIAEGQSLSAPLVFYPATPGRMLLIVAAIDELGNRVFSDFIGLNFNAQSDSLIREF